MDNREALFARWGGWAAVHWKKALLAGLILTLVMGAGMAFLRLEMTFYSILPQESSQVRDLRLITEEFPISNAIIVVVEGEDRAHVTGVLDDLEAEFSREEYAGDVDTVQARLDVDFFKRHGLMLSEPADLKRLRRMYADLSLVPLFTHLNDDFEAEYSGNEANLQEDEELAVGQIRGLEKLLAVMVRPDPGREEVGAALDQFLFGESSLLSRDATMGLMILQPTFTMNDINKLGPGVMRLDGVAKEVAARSGATAGLTGLTVVGKDEMVTAEQGLALSSLIALLLIVGLMILTFRMLSVPLIAGLPLLVGIFWTMGLTGFVIHRLNIMTAMYLIVLMGLGIDYAIHLLSTFVQERDRGQDFYQAVSAAFGKSGAGILTGALTTAVAFFSLNLAESAVVKELGTVAGLGILCELVAMFLFIPAFLGLRHRRMEKRGKKEPALLKKVSLNTRFMPGLGKVVKKAPVPVILLTLALAAFLGFNAPEVDVEGNLMNMEAEGLESILLQDKMVEEFGMAPDSLYVTTSELAEMKALATELEALSSIKQVDSLAPYITTEAEWQERVPLIRELVAEWEAFEPAGGVDRALLAEELYRLEDNLLEMSDLAFLGGMEKLRQAIDGLTGRSEEAGGSLISAVVARLEGEIPVAENQKLIAAELKSRLLGMGDLRRVTPELLPQTLRDSYISTDGNNYLLTLIPTRNPWEEDFRDIYTRQIKTVTDKGTGMLLAADQMTRIARVDGIRSAIAALIAIFFLLLIDFRNFKLTCLTLVPLLAAFASLFGFMALTGIKFDFINFIAIPLLIGIGVDDVVHINHRYLLEGPGKMDLVIGKTGAAVLMTTLTTIIGFASFIPSVMRAMSSTGVVLSVAMVFAFLFSILLHPALLVLLVEKGKLNIQAWKRRKV